MFINMLCWWLKLDTRVKGALLGLTAFLVVAPSLWLITDRVGWTLVALGIGVLCTIGGWLIYLFSEDYEEEKFPSQYGLTTPRPRTTRRHTLKR